MKVFALYSSVLVLRGRGRKPLDERTNGQARSGRRSGPGYARRSCNSRRRARRRLARVRPSRSYGPAARRGRSGPSRRVGERLVEDLGVFGSSSTASARRRARGDRSVLLRDQPRPIALVEGALLEPIERAHALELSCAANAASADESIPPEHDPDQDVRDQVRADQSLEPLAQLLGQLLLAL